MAFLEEEFAYADGHVSIVVESLLVGGLERHADACHRFIPPPRWRLRRSRERRASTQRSPLRCRRAWPHRPCWPTRRPGGRDRFACSQPSIPAATCRTLPTAVETGGVRVLLRPCSAPAECRSARSIDTTRACRFSDRRSVPLSPNDGSVRFLTVSPSRIRPKFTIAPASRSARTRGHVEVVCVVQRFRSVGRTAHGAGTNELQSAANDEVVAQRLPDRGAELVRATERTLLPVTRVYLVGFGSLPL